VNWLIDNTFLEKPLFFWAEMWGVRDDFMLDQTARELPPPTPSLHELHHRHAQTPLDESGI
jgi:hypothetical protein